jgi:heparan-alpha-glucosaminide N-acetyltransferase
MQTSPTISPVSSRLVSIDAYRGLVMFLVCLRMLELDEVALCFPESGFWQVVGFHSSHVPWVGCSLNDVIHPSFVFLTGVSLVFSVAARSAKGQSKWTMTWHALWRSLVLILLGIFLRSQGRPMTNWTFDETLTQTGLGYMALFGLTFAGNKLRWAVFVLILAGAWVFYAWHPIIPPHPNPDAFNTASDWKHDFTGFFGHWNHNRNAGWSLDLWLLNEFPRPRPYVGYLGGYVTVNFITTIGTMILGLMAGTWLRQARHIEGGAKWVTTRFWAVGAVCLILGVGLHGLGICPLVKRLWTPSWVFFSGGLCFLILALLYQIVDVRLYRRWAFPFVILGMNSIAIYLMRHTLDGWLFENLERHLGLRVFQVFGPELQPVLMGAFSVMILWSVILWMHRMKLYLRI